MNQSVQSVAPKDRPATSNAMKTSSLLRRLPIRHSIRPPCKNRMAQKSKTKLSAWQKKGKNLSSGEEKKPASDMSIRKPRSEDHQGRNVSLSWTYIDLWFSPTGPTYKNWGQDGWSYASIASALPVLDLYGLVIFRCCNHWVETHVYNCSNPHSCWWHPNSCWGQISVSGHLSASLNSFGVRNFRKKPTKRSIGTENPRLSKSSFSVFSSGALTISSTSMDLSAYITVS